MSIMVWENFEMEVAEVWDLPVREWPDVTGPVRTGRLESRQPTELVDEKGVVPVPSVVVEYHSRTGQLSVVLVEVDKESVRPGQILRSRTRWPCYSTVRLTSTHQGIEMGATGTIVEVYGTAYEVEIDDEAGRVIFLGAIEDDDLELVEE